MYRLTLAQAACGIGTVGLMASAKLGSAKMAVAVTASVQAA